ncbi:MAG TPA: 3-oxoacyl-[acyl-carrier-protein] synthase III C-terminal domain-containing protein [Solirubrobacteraceae bacterium]|nr:3-oxoacyl-[acyl-carrier-protein] synthase III C-terminal domain-containing protein [Solirubrobacteraceae bacterium]
MPNTLADWSATAELRDNLTPSRRTGPRIAGIAVSDSESTYSQEQVLERLGLKGDEFAERIFARSGVKRRHLDLSDDFLGKTLQGRAQQIEQDLLRHSINAVDALELDPLQIGTVLSSSLYSLGAPTLAHRILDHYEMHPATDNYHISGVGCASGVPLMRLAIQTMSEQPGKQALVVAAESMSGILTRATAEDPRAKTVGSAIFGDGCAAAVLCSDPGADGPVIVDSQVHQIAGTLDAVRLDLTAGDSYLHLARELPDIGGAALPALVTGFLRRNHLEHSDIDHWMAHPGGRRIVENVQSALGLSGDDLATSWGALAEHGNVGTPSILYVLRDTIARRDPQEGEHGLMVTIGPGVTLGLMLLGW